MVTMKMKTLISGSEIQFERGLYAAYTVSHFKYCMRYRCTIDSTYAVLKCLSNSRLRSRYMHMRVHLISSYRSRLSTVHHVGRLLQSMCI
jgi:hypothetical protein